MKFSILTAFVIAYALSACAGENRTASQAEATAPAAEQTVKEEPAVISGSDAEIFPHATLPTVIDFNAVWCPPCRRFGPIFEQVAEEMRGKAIFVSVDVDNASTPAHQFGVSSILRSPCSCLTARPHQPSASCHARSSSASSKEPSNDF